MRFLRCAYVVHVSRLYTDAAHILAKEASCYNLDNVWLKDIPRCIDKIVLRKQCNPSVWDQFFSINDRTCLKN
jgi:hypothetical protein